MNPLESFKIALLALRTNLLRSILTTLGIIIGVGSVIVMVAVGAGARSEVDRQIAALGSQTLNVIPGSSRVMGRSGGSGTTLPISEGDLKAIRDKIPGVVAISGLLGGSAQVVRGNTNWTTSINGVHDEFFTVREWQVLDGREFTKDEMRSGARLAVIGQTVALKLFGDGASPLGQTIRIKNVPFTVIGVLGPKGQSSFGSDQDDVIMLPITAARGRIVGRSQVVNDSIGRIQVKFDDDVNLAEAQEAIEQLMRQRRRIQPGAEDDFFVRNFAEFMRARTAALSTMTWLLAATSAISLIVGGIGIMNIMLVSVTERTREIGLRMAVGGRRRDILMQFLVEAVTLCLLGGLIGVMLGGIVAFIVATSAQWPILISKEAILVAMAAAAATGIFFGFFPARRAAYLNPIDALRSE
ncbi:MAG TPA: ABC transporter permease [Hyphomicrobiaceae bacterium]|nr:ABC transporter permease [Hyphomicrobiaceae bacterium]